MSSSEAFLRSASVLLGAGSPAPAGGRGCRRLGRLFGDGDREFGGGFVGVARELALLERERADALGERVLEEEIGQQHGFGRALVAERDVEQFVAALAPVVAQRPW